MNAADSNELPRSQAETSPLAAFRQVVNERRSIRVFDGEPLPEAVVNDCLDLAMLAPSSSNLQPWEFYWVRSTDQKAALVEACLEQPAAKTAGDLIVIVARTGTWRQMRAEMLQRLKAPAQTPAPAALLDYYGKLIPFLMTQGPLDVFGWVKRLIFFGRGLFKATPRGPASHADVRVWAVKSTALAAENMMLALKAHGYDSCPMEGFDERRVSRLLGLPHDAVVVMVLGAGKAKPEGLYGPRVRFERSWFVKEV